MKDMKLPPKFWSEKDVSDATHASLNGSYHELCYVALRILKRMKRMRPESIIAIVCGSITTGGTLPGAEVKKNLEAFASMILRLEARGGAVFNQLPFEEYLFAILRARPNESPDVLLESFYLPIFESGNIQLAYFLPGWEKSHGALWENEQIKRLNLAYCLVDRI